MKRKTDIEYLTDLFTKFNMVNLQLPGDRLNLIEKKSILSAFLARVKLMKQNIGLGKFSQFPNLSQTSCQEDDVSTYVQHLNALYSDFESRFEDILTMVIPPWIINPYSDIEETNVIIQEELTELSTNEELKVQFKNGYQQFWLQDNIPVTYTVWKNGKKVYICLKLFLAIFSVIQRRENTIARKIQSGSGIIEKRGEDKRSFNNVNKFEAVKEFIASLKGHESHYGRAKSRRIYLSAENNITALWNLYNQVAVENLKVNYKHPPTRTSVPPTTMNSYKDVRFADC
ncbi:unnamed protein product [Acanthoscelides obtectus]|uniref:Uncharacterized protein n=1 Tax=Acanthoscelides obtectus TaxID=200917 RepID=A0A9P0MC61_ACAOB|nr:unnamed protein product [Acanthoscelides obtectus]CAK1635021.1 General transcription factor II-I repeat domain-containing protein 2 [Acanthoscelides obtectus]